jgi:hypothetical protein
MGSVQKKSIQSTIMTLKNIAKGSDTKMGLHSWSVPYPVKTKENYPNYEFIKSYSKTNYINFKGQLKQAREN